MKTDKTHRRGSNTRTNGKAKRRAQIVALMIGNGMIR